MSRPRFALLLLLGLASPGAAQTASTAAWTLPILPRIVYDTAHEVDEVRTTGTQPAGFAAGMSAWPAARYCDGPTSAATQPLNPAAVLDRVQLAARCGIRLMIVPPRRFLTTSGEATGPFSVDSAKRVTDRFAAALPPDTLRKYRETILGFNLADDYGCTRCWGGERITQAQIAEWAAYARAKLPGLPLGVRKTPDWVADYPALAPLLDYTWAQYHTRKGDQQAFYDKAATIAKRLGLRVVMGINVEDCYGVGTSACDPEDLIQLGTVAVSHPASCAFLNWKYAEKTWRRAEIREAWDELMALARTRPAAECRRAEAGA